MKTYYAVRKVLRVGRTKNWVLYKWWEDFYPERGEASSWGCREQSGYRVVWLEKGADINDVMNARDRF